MKRTIAAVMVCLGMCLAVPAQQASAPAAASAADNDAPATREDVQRYFDAIHYHDASKTIMNAMNAQFRQVLHQQLEKQKDYLPAGFEAQMNAAMDEMLANMPLDEMLDAAIPVYEKHFTKGELNDLVAFYSTPTGQKLQRDLPAVTAESMQAMMPIVMQYEESIQKKLQARIAAVLEERSKPEQPDSKPKPQQ